MNEAIIHVVDDDEGVRDSLELLLQLSGYSVRTYSSGDEFVKALDHIKPGCVLLDIHMPGMTGLQVQKLMQDRGCSMPVIVMTGQGDIGMAVRAMKSGAADFIEKPYSNELISSAVDAAVSSMHASAEEQERVQTARAKVSSLSARELEVLQGLLSALPNKLIAYELGISIRTVEVYRAKIMDKLGARGLSEAVRIALLAGVEPMIERNSSATTTNTSRNELHGILPQEALTRRLGN